MGAPVGAAESCWHGRWALLWGAVTPRTPGTGASLNFGAAGPGSFPAPPMSPTPLQLRILLQVLPLPMDPSGFIPLSTSHTLIFYVWFDECFTPLCLHGEDAQPKSLPRSSFTWVTVIPAGTRICLGHLERLHRVTISGPSWRSCPKAGGREHPVTPDLHHGVSRPG